LTTGVASACPQCGAPLRFGGAASLAAVCAYCRSAVLRAGARLELAGKVPDLVATDTRLALGATGRLQDRPFVILGRLQLSQGEATWDEWYASFGDGWGWLAEAQGRLYATRPIAGASALPPLDSLRPGAEIELPGGAASVDEVNEARLVSFEGELPVRPEVGETWRYADCSTASGGFATLDYGSGREPVLYAGREVSYAEAGIADRAPLTAGAEPARALTCPGCGGRIELRRPDSRAFACPSCRSLLDVTGGDLRVVSVLEGRSRPPIPLGAKGTLRGEAVEVLGFLVRSIEVEGERYPWQELLLHGAGGYRWLSVYAGHWLFLRPMAGAEVSPVGGRAARCRGRTFKHFQGGKARYDEIQGEFTWEIRAGEEILVDDYVAPPLLLSAERTEGEVSWSLGEHVAGDEIWKAFSLPGAPPRAIGVGAAEPNPIAPRIGSRWKTACLFLLALAVLAAAVGALEPRDELLALDVPLEAGRVTLSDPFQLSGGPQAVEIAADADVRQAWIGLDVALIEDETGESETVAFELSHYSGVSEGEAWSEGLRRGQAVIGSVRDGRYLLRVEPQVDRGHGYLPATARVRVVRGVFLWPPLVAALAVVCAWPVLLTFRAAAFEKRRWQESDHPWGGKG
jgi:Domain of unknown function (DUF4178)